MKPDQTKRVLLLAAIFAAPLVVFGQGRVNFNNRVIGAVVAPIYGINPDMPMVTLRGNANTNGGTVDYTGWPLLSGTGWSAALWAGLSGSDSLLEVATTTFRTAANGAGFVQPLSNVSVPAFFDNNSPVDFQVRVWDNRNGTITSWAAALAVPGLPSSYSDIFTINLQILPSIPQDLVGLTSFNITAIVPEPSIIAFIVIAIVLHLIARVQRSKV